MPELPEVETIKRQIAPLLPLAINNISTSKHFLSLAKYSKNNISSLPQLLTYKTLQRIERYGKMLIFHFEEQLFLISQLGMSGKWLILNEAPLTFPPHTHLMFAFKNIHSEQTEKLNGKKIASNCKYLIYVDPRRFGKLEFIQGLKNLEHKFNPLPPDLLDKAINTSYIYHALQKMPNREIKVALLEQKYFAGCGNYIANEVCAHAHILPMRKCSTLQKSDCQKIAHAFKKILSSAILAQGVSFARGYQDAAGQEGLGFKNLIVFYQKICQHCHSTPVTKIFLKARGTYFCVQCQK